MVIHISKPAHQQHRAYQIGTMTTISRRRPLCPPGLALHGGFVADTDCTLTHTLGTVAAPSLCLRVVRLTVLRSTLSSRCQTGVCRPLGSGPVLLAWLPLLTVWCGCRDVQGGSGPSPLCLSHHPSVTLSYRLETTTLVL